MRNTANAAEKGIDAGSELMVSLVQAAREENAKELEEKLIHGKGETIRAMPETKIAKPEANEMPEKIMGTKKTKTGAKERSTRNDEYIDPKSPQFCEEKGQNAIFEFCDVRCRPRNRRKSQTCSERPMVKHCGCDYENEQKTRLRSKGLMRYKVRTLNI